MEVQTYRKKATKAKRGLLRIIFSRAGMFLLLIAIQIALFVASTLYLEEYRSVIYSLLKLLSVVVLIYIINEEGNPAFKITWILFVLVFPVIGTLFYVYVKLQPGTHLVKNHLIMLQEETAPYMIQKPEVLSEIKAGKTANANLSHYLCHTLGFPTYHHTQIEYFPLGEDKFRSMLAELRRAKKFIFLEYFIVEEGVLWDEILSILKDKVRKGVEVRLMYDGMCAIAMLPYNYPKRLRHYGIKCKMSNKLRPFFTTVQNNRDHRKICVIDGKIAYTGGINIGDEYINKKVRFGHWKDTAVMLKGEAVQSLTMFFLQMWNVDERMPEDYKKYLTPEMSFPFQDSLGYVIPYADSPFDQEEVGEEVYFHILNHSKKYVHIMTPYLVLDNEMLTTLCRVAKGGVEVIIIMPHIPDKWYAFVLGKTYYHTLIQSGVKIYEYLPGFVHAKVFVSDDDTATVGTINLDYRSLYLHFECGVFICNNPEVKAIEEDFQKTLEKCKQITLMEVKKSTLLTKLSGQILRLFAPFM